MRISDWSSDVCSSDLHAAPPDGGEDEQARPARVRAGSAAAGKLRPRRSACGGEAGPASRCDRLRCGQASGPVPGGAPAAATGPVDLPIPAEGECRDDLGQGLHAPRSEEHTSELQSLMRISYAVFCLKKKTVIC